MLLYLLRAALGRSRGGWKMLFNIVAEYLNEVHSEAVFDESPPVMDQVVITLVVNEEALVLSDCDMIVLEDVNLLDQALDIVDEEPELAEGVFVQVFVYLFEPILELQI